MHSRRLLIMTGLVGLTFATAAGINSVKAGNLAAEAAVGADGPRDPALERMLERHVASASQARPSR